MDARGRAASRPATSKRRRASSSSSPPQRPTREAQNGMTRTVVPHMMRIIDNQRNANPNKKNKDFGKKILNFYQMSIAQRKKTIEEDIVTVRKHNDDRMLAEEASRVTNFIATDPLMALGFPAGTKYSGDEVLSQQSKYRAYRLRQLYGDDYVFAEDDNIVDCPEKLDDLSDTTIFKPAPTRLRITEDFTISSARNPIPVYSDLEGETINNVRLPRTFFFDYITDNVIDKLREPRLAKASEMAKIGSPNHIKCDCSSAGPLVNCFNNKECPCYQLNKKLQQLQKDGDEHELTKFDSFTPKVLSGVHPMFYSHYAFACSEDCGCHGKCTNNPLLIVDRDVFKLEIFRQNPEMGFLTRSTSFIPGGTICFEFIGEVVDSCRLEESVTDYSYQLTNPSEDKRFFEFIEYLRDWSGDYRDLLCQLYESEYHIDCKLQGNFTRMFPHSCTPNLESVRIFQRSLSPAHMRMAFMSLTDIHPGEQLSIDYGGGYQKIVKKFCLCKSVACINGPNAEIFKELNLASSQAVLHRLSNQAEDKMKAVLQYGRENYESADYARRDKNIVRRTEKRIAEPDEVIDLD